MYGIRVPGVKPDINHPVIANVGTTNGRAFMDESSHMTAEISIVSRCQ